MAPQGDCYFLRPLGDQVNREYTVFALIKKMLKSIKFWIFISVLFIVVILFFNPHFLGGQIFYQDEISALKKNINDKIIPALPPLDTVAYDKKINELANNLPPPAPITKVVKDEVTGENKTITITPVVPVNTWPVVAPYPNAGAILPFKRIIAYYGNLYSTRMGVLGEYKEEEMFRRLQAEVDKWNLADPTTPALPALHYIAVTAQLSAGEDGKHRLRMPHKEIDKIIAMAKKINAIVFLDIQVGFSTVEVEVPLLEKYLKMPEVHLGIDPEFSMKNGIRPGKVVGTFDATDMNFVANYLAKIVKENNIPPKIFVIHRYTQRMVTNAKDIKPLPEVQIVMHMDGWGASAKKINTYQQFIHKEPVQFTGFKLFYKNDVLTPGTTLMTPDELLKLRPKPIYIQYQ